MARTVLITGGSSGIGRAMVHAFVAQGDHVIFTYHAGKQRAQEVVEAAGSEHVRALPLDQGDHASVMALVASLDRPVDVLINNAALGTKTVERYVEGRAAQDEALLRVNAVGPLWLTDALLPGMLERGHGTIINISSVGGGIASFPGFRLADIMSKAALAAMTRQLAATLAHEPVDVFAICPGATETAMFEASTLDPLSPEERERFEARLPRGRLITPDEIAALAVFLASDAAPVLHGAVLDASLGLGVHPGAITGEH